MAALDTILSGASLSGDIRGLSVGTHDGTANDIMLANGTTTTIANFITNNLDSVYAPLSHTHSNYLLNTTDTLSGDLSITGDLKMVGTDSYIWTPSTASGFTGFWDSQNNRIALRYQNNIQGWGVMGNPVSGNALYVTGTIGTNTHGNSSQWNVAYNDKINSASFSTSNGVLTLNQQDGGSVTVDLDNRYAYYDHIRSLGTQAFTNGTNPNLTTAQLVTEMEGDGAFDSYTSVFKTSWNYAGNYDLTDAGRFTETAGTSWITWTDNSSDTTTGNITALVIAPNTGGSAGGVYIYNDQGSTYAPGWREVWTSMTDGEGSGLDADLLDGQQGSYYLAWANLTGVPTFDNYQSWNLKTNGVQRTTVTSGGNLDLVAGSNVSLSYGAGGVVTISSTDTNTNTTYTAGGGLSLSGTTFSHSDTSSQGSLTALTGANVISDIDVDTYGHVTSMATRALTLADLGYTGATNANNYVLPEATATTRGGIELFSNTDQVVAANSVSAVAGRTYGIQLNAAGQAVVNVPWTDTNTVYTHPTYAGDDINIDTGVLSGATVISDLDFNITTDTLGHVTDANALISTRNLTLADLGYTGDTNAEVNQNAYSNIAVSGQTTVSADSKTDTLNLAAGSNITITTDAATDTVTIASTASGGGGGYNFVASESIGNGDAVVLKSDGQIELVKESVNASAVGNAVTFHADGVGYGDLLNGSQMARLDDTRFIVFYHDGTPFPDIYYARVGTITGTTITLGTEVQIHIENASQGVSCCVVDTDKVVFGFPLDSTNGNRFVVGTVVGNAISLGTPFDDPEEHGGELEMVTLRNNEFLVAIKEGASPFRGVLQYYSVNGTTITQEATDTSSYSRDKIRLELLSEGVVVFHNYNGSTGYLAIVECSNGVITSNTAVTYNTGSILEWDLVKINDTTFAVFYSLFSDYYGKYRVCTVANGAITMQNVVTFRASGTYEIKAEYLEDNKFLLIHRVTNSNQEAYLCTVSGTTVTIGTGETYSTANHIHNEIIHLGQGYFIVSFTDNSSTYIGKVLCYKAETVTSNKNNFIGFAETAINSAGTGTITILGGINESQSGLNANTDYYIDNQGNLTTNSENNVYVGRAISSTKIQVKN